MRYRNTVEVTYKFSIDVDADSIKAVNDYILRYQPKLLIPTEDNLSRVEILKVEKLDPDWDRTYAVHEMCWKEPTKGDVGSPSEPPNEVQALYAIASQDPEEYGPPRCGHCGEREEAYHFCESKNSEGLGESCIPFCDDGILPCMRCQGGVMVRTDTGARVCDECGYVEPGQRGPEDEVCPEHGETCKPCCHKPASQGGCR